MTAIRNWILAALLAAPSAFAASSDEQIRTALEDVRADRDHRIAGHRLLSIAILEPFYAARAHAPAWTDDARVDEIMRLFADAESHGLTPNDFLLHSLQQMAKTQDDTVRAQRDLLLSEALIRYAYQREFGKVNPHRLDPDVNFRRELDGEEPPHVILQQWLDEGGFSEKIDTLAHHGTWYDLLRGELHRLFSQAQQGGWPALDDGPTLRSGDVDPRVRQVRARLAFQPGETALQPVNPDRFDEALEARVRSFQKGHDLDVDGAVGPATRRAMNVPVEDRIDQVRLALERLRWVNQESAHTDDFLAANIPGYRVYLVRDGQIQWTTRAMVGKPYRQTPVFTSDLAYLEFNPTWTVPPGIHRRDVLPKVKADINHLEEKHFEVLDHQGNRQDPTTIDWNSFGSVAPYIFRQTPGPWNALGQVKFIFPNSHFVFFHDTNHRELFVEHRRAFSSGCIRVEDPMDLAELLLAGEDGWDRTAIDDLVASGETRRVRVSERMPVLLLYLTAAIDDDGSVMYIEDVYDRDSRLLKALDAPMFWDPPAGLTAP